MVLATPSPATDDLARALGADVVVAAPGPPPDEGWGWAWDDVLAGWRAQVEALTPAAQVVVCTWPPAFAVTPLAELSPAAWRTQVEWPTALWFTTLVAAAERVTDDGALVAVVERPATLDAPGHGTTVAVADGVANVVRSMAATHGPRAVRVNAVATSLHTAPPSPVGAPPRLGSFPGTVADEVAGGVRLLLSPEASGVTATTMATDCGRR